MSQIGILIRNNKENNTFVINKEGWTTAVNLGKHSTAYLYWRTLKAIKMGNTLIDSPKMTHKPLTISNLSFEMNEYYFDSENVTKTLGTICKKYNSTLDDILPPIVDHWVTRIKADTDSNLTIVRYASIAIMIAVIICWIIYLHCVILKLKFSVQCIAALQKNDSSCSKLIKDRNSI